jgi:hypothetical protein
MLRVLAQPLGDSLGTGSEVPLSDHEVVPKRDTGDWILRSQAGQPAWG